MLTNTPAPLDLFLAEYMRDSISNRRWLIGLAISPFAVEGFPARLCFTFDENLSRALEQVQQALARTPYAAIEFDDGWPKLLVDHYGFCAMVKRCAPHLETEASVKDIFTKSDLRALRLICKALPEPHSSWGK